MTQAGTENPVRIGAPVTYTKTGPGNKEETEMKYFEVDYDGDEEVYGAEDLASVEKEIESQIGPRLNEDGSQNDDWPARFKEVDPDAYMYPSKGVSLREVIEQEPVTIPEGSSAVLITSTFIW